RFGRFYAVRQGDAHSWVEVYLDGAGWVLFDPTPAAGAVPQVETAGLLALLRDIPEAAAQRWSRRVVVYDLGRQLRVLRWGAYKYGGAAAPSGWLGGRSERRRLVIVALLLTTAGILYWQWLRRRRHAPRPARDASESYSAAQIVAL